MTTRIQRVAGAAAAVAAAVSLVAACSSSGGSTAPASGGGSNSGSGGPSSASSTAIPTQDVVSAVKADPKLTAELPAAVRSSGTIRLGTTLQPGVAGLPHGGQTSDGTNVGLDVDLRDAVAKALGVKFDVQNGTFATIIPGVQNGKYDVGQDNFGVTTARLKIVDFATYLNDGQALLGSKDVDLSSVSQITDICGFTVATSPGSTFQQILNANAPKCAAAGKKPYTVQYFADAGPIFLGLANGKIDIYFGPTLSLKYDATHIAGTKFLGQVSTTPVGFVTAKDSPLTKPISDAVNALIASGDYDKIFAKWGLAGSGISKSEVNPSATL